MLCMRAFRAPSNSHSCRFQTDALLPQIDPLLSAARLKAATPAFTKFETSRRLAHQLLTKGPTAAQARLAAATRRHHLQSSLLPPSSAASAPASFLPAARVHRHGVLLSLQAPGPVRALPVRCCSRLRRTNIRTRILDFQHQLLQGKRRQLPRLPGHHHQRFRVSAVG